MIALVSSPLLHLREVRVGSESTPKIEAVRRALEPYTDCVGLHGVEVESGVAEQPIGFPEIIAGARNRARAAFRSGPCDLAVGIEDGLVELHDVGSEALNIGAACVSDGRRESLGLSAGFGYPPDCLGPALSGREPVGALFDRFWRERAVRGRDRALPSGVGNIGRLSLGVLPRAEYGRQAVLCALLRFLNPELYFDADLGSAPDARRQERE